MAKHTPARLDPHGTEKPRTRIVTHANPDHCFGPGVPLNRPEYEAEDGSRVPLEVPVESVKLFDRVRSFDFSGRDNCYVEGKVVGFAEIEDCKRYAILVERRVFQGQPEPVAPGEVIYPPVNGTRTTMGNVTNGVKVIK